MLKRFVPIATRLIERERVQLTQTYVLNDLRDWLHQEMAPDQTLDQWQRSHQGSDRNGMSRVLQRLKTAGLVRIIWQPGRISFRVIQLEDL